MSLRLWEEPAWHPPAMMLGWPGGVGVPDCLESVAAVPSFGRLQRAVAAWVGLGGWVDRLAWAEVVNPPCGEVSNAVRCARMPVCRFCARFADLDLPEEEADPELAFDLEPYEEPSGAVMVPFVSLPYEPWIVNTRPL